MSNFPKDWAVRSDYLSVNGTNGDDGFIEELREVANSDLPDNEKLELLVGKLDITCPEDVSRYQEIIMVDLLTIRQLNKNLPVPEYKSELASGLDLMASLEEPVIILPRKRHTIPTGIAVAIAPGFEGQIRSRSGLALDHGVVVLNSPGTIDADFRGEIHVILINHGDNIFIVEPAMRIAQLVIAPVMRAEPVLVDYLCETERGSGGFGSTGVLDG